MLFKHTAAYWPHRENGHNEREEGNKRGHRSKHAIAKLVNQFTCVDALLNRRDSTRAKSFRSTGGCGRCREDHARESRSEGERELEARRECDLLLLIAIRKEFLLRGMARKGVLGPHLG